VIDDAPVSEAEHSFDVDVDAAFAWKFWTNVANGAAGMGTLADAMSRAENRSLTRPCDKEFVVSYEHRRNP
jgi:hypothetical protein